MASHESDSLSNIISRRRRKILNDGIFELTDEDRDSPTSLEKCTESNITKKYNSDTISSTVSKMTTCISNPDLENSVESGELNSTESDFINEVEELKAENERLREKLEILLAKEIASSTEGPEPKKPLFTVSFRDRETALKYKSDIIKLLCSSVNCNSSQESTESDLEVDLWENESNNESDIELQNLFVVDSDPATIENNQNIPYYKKVLNQAITENEKQKEKKAIHISQNTCFNCGEFHQLRDCTQAKNHERVNLNRQQFVRNNSMKNSRYHQEEEVNKRFSDLKPGKISEKLRHALGLRRHELPRHIYKMRILGYPPGWLEEAMSQKSGLKLFKEKNDDENSHPNLLSEDMIYEYPGFNMPLSPGTKDEYRVHNCPPFHYSQTKEALNILPNPLIKQSKVDRISPPVDVDISHTDMDVEDFIQEENTIDVNTIHVEDIRLPEEVTPPGEEPLLIPPLPTDSYNLNETPPPPPPPESEDVPSKHTIQIDSSEELSLSSADQNSRSSRATSLSLSDLETQKRLLLSELHKESTEKSNISSETENQESNILKNNESIINLDDSSLNEKSNIDTTSNLNESVVLLTPNISIIDLTSPVSESSNNLAKNNSSDISLKKDIDSDNNSHLLHTPVQSNYQYNSALSPGESSCSNENDLVLRTRSNVSSQLGAVKSTLKGTPILKNVSPYARLPDQSKFARDMGPLLNFENLPDSIGKYDKMKDLIKKVRVCYKKILKKN